MKESNTWLDIISVSIVPVSVIQPLNVEINHPAADVVVDITRLSATK